MEDNKTIETLEEELKLLKGELKQSLASVRDYLLNMELPSSEFATVLAALGGENTQKITLDGGIMSQAAKHPEEPPQEELESLPQETVEEEEQFLPDEEMEDADELNPEDPLGEHEGLSQPRMGSEAYEDNRPDEDQEETTDDFSDELGPEVGEDFDESLDDEFNAGDDDDLLGSEPELYTEEEPMEQVKVNDEIEQSIPKVNLLANLISWVARAKRDIGPDQIPIMLEVYGISGHLSPELKEVILHLADITQAQSEETSPAEIWSQTMSSLHGVLTGGDAPFFPLKPVWGESESELTAEEEEDITEVEKTSDMPVKLKLVFPNGDGKGKEFCIDLTPESGDS